MDPEKIKALATLLNVPLGKLESVLSSSGDEEDNNGNGGGISQNFYFNPDIFAKLHSIDYAGLRKLVMPNMKNIRRA